MSKSFIYNAPTNKTSSNQADCYFTQIGQHDFIDEQNNPRANSETDNKVLAKIKFKDNGKPKYLIRIDHNKRLFNPTNESAQKSKNKSIDLFLPNFDAFKEVSQKVFDFYTTFLRTSNTSWINHAEREDF